MHKTTDTSRPRAKAHIYLNTHLKSHKFFHVNCQLQSKKRQNSLKTNILPLVLIKEEKETFSLSSLSSLRENDPDEKDTSREDFREKLCRVFLFVKNENRSRFGIVIIVSGRGQQKSNAFRRKDIHTHTHARVNEARFGFRV